jgi:predicted DNA-binding transcriptional regulator YafY
MPLNRNKEKRYSKIDELLQKKKLTLSEFQNELERAGFPISRRTLQTDLKEFEDKVGNEKFIKNQYGKSKRFYYDDPKISYFDPLDEDTILNLQRLTDYLKGFDGFKELDTLSNKVYEVCSKYNLDTDSHIISFDKTGQLGNTGRMNLYIERLYCLISNHVVAHVKMESYNKDGDKACKEVYIHPYHLKEYQGRWYLIGYCQEDERKEKTVLPIDRMKNVVENEEIEYKEPDPKVDYSSIFDDRIGIGDGPVIKLKIKVRSALRYKYFMSKSLHSSQKEEDMIDGCHVLKYRIVNNKELHQKLRSYGDDIEILEPLDLRKKIADSLERAAKLYRND